MTTARTYRSEFSANRSLAASRDARLDHLRRAYAARRAPAAPATLGARLSRPVEGLDLIGAAIVLAIIVAVFC